MPKEVLQLTKFSGGLNCYSDARDIEDDQFEQNWNAIVDKAGVIRVSGMAENFINTDFHSNDNFNPGFGLYQISVDNSFAEIKSDFGSGLTSGTIATATNSTVHVLEDKTSTSSTNDYYNGMIIFIYAGLRKGESRVITDYVGSSRTITTEAFSGTLSTSSKYIIYPWKLDGTNWSGTTPSDDEDVITNGVDLSMEHSIPNGTSNDYYIFSKATATDDKTKNLGSMEYAEEMGYQGTGVTVNNADISATVSDTTVTVDGVTATHDLLLNRRIFKYNTSTKVATFFGVCTQVISGTSIRFSGGIANDITNNDELYISGIEITPGMKTSLSFSCSTGKYYSLISNGIESGISDTGINVNNGSGYLASITQTDVTVDGLSANTVFEGVTGGRVLHRDVYKSDGTFVGRCTAVNSNTVIRFEEGIRQDLADDDDLYVSGWGERVPWVELYSPTCATSDGRISDLNSFSPSATAGGVWSANKFHILEPFSTTASSENVQNPTFYVNTIADGTPTFHLTTNRGRGFAVDDTLLFKNPDDASDTRTLTVKEIDRPGLSLYANDTWIPRMLTDNYITYNDCNYVDNGDFAVKLAEIVDPSDSLVDDTNKIEQGVSATPEDFTETNIANFGWRKWAHVHPHNSNLGAYADPDPTPKYYDGHEENFVIWSNGSELYENGGYYAGEPKSYYFQTLKLDPNTLYQWSFVHADNNGMKYAVYYRELEATGVIVDNGSGYNNDLDASTASAPNTTINVKTVTPAAAGISTSNGGTRIWTEDGRYVGKVTAKTTSSLTFYYGLAVDLVDDQELYVGSDFIGSHAADNGISRYLVPWTAEEATDDDINDGAVYKHIKREQSIFSNSDDDFTYDYIRFMTPNGIDYNGSNKCLIEIRMMPNAMDNSRVWTAGHLVHKAYNDLISMSYKTSAVSPWSRTGISWSQYKTNFTLPKEYSKVNDWKLKIHAGHHGHRASNDLGAIETRVVAFDNIRLSTTKPDVFTLLTDNTNHSSNISIHSKLSGNWDTNFIKWADIDSKPNYNYVNGMLKISDGNFSNANQNKLFYWNNGESNTMSSIEGWNTADSPLPQPPLVVSQLVAGETESGFLSAIVFDACDYWNTLFKDMTYTRGTYATHTGWWDLKWPMDQFGAGRAGTAPRHPGLVCRYFHSSATWAAEGGTRTSDSVGSGAINWTGGRGHQLYQVPKSYEFESGVDDLGNPIPDSNGTGTNSGANGETQWYLDNIYPAAHADLKGEERGSNWTWGDNIQAKDGGASTKLGYGPWLHDYGFRAGWAMPEETHRNHNVKTWVIYSDDIIVPNTSEELPGLKSFAEANDLGDIGRIESSFTYENMGTTANFDDSWSSVMAGPRVLVAFLKNPNLGSVDTFVETEQRGRTAMDFPNSLGTMGNSETDWWVGGQESGPDGVYNQTTKNISQNGYSRDPYDRITRYVYRQSNDNAHSDNTIEMDFKQEQSFLPGQLTADDDTGAHISIQEGGNWSYDDTKQLLWNHSGFQKQIAGEGAVQENYYSEIDGYHDGKDWQRGEEGSTGTWTEYAWHSGLNSGGEERAEEARKKHVWMTLYVNKFKIYFYDRFWSDFWNQEDEAGTDIAKIVFMFGMPEVTSIGWGGRTYKVATSVVNIFGEESGLSIGEDTIGELEDSDNPSTINEGEAPSIQIQLGSAVVNNPLIKQTKIYMKASNSDIWYLQTYINHNTRTIHSTISNFSITGIQSSTGSFSSTWHIGKENMKDFNEVSSYESETFVSQDDAIVPMNVNLDCRYKTSVVANNRLYVGNIFHDKNIYGDKMLKSPIGKYNILPQSSFIDVAINDGDEITSLAYYKDKILQFKKKKVFIINVSGDYEFLEDTFHNVGVLTSASVCTTPHGIVWANNMGCYLYDGKELKDLIKNRIPTVDDYSNITNNFWNSQGSSTDELKSPSVGYVVERDAIVVKFTIDNNASISIPEGASFHFPTESWNFFTSVFSGNSGALSGKTSNMITNDSGDIIYYTSTGTNSVTSEIKKWSHTPAVGAAATKVFYFSTKDFTFGDIVARKKIYKIYVTYRTTSGVNSTILVKTSINGLNTYTTAINASTSVFAGTSDACYHDSNGLLNTAGTWKTAELKFTTPSNFNNIYSLQLQFTSPTVEAGFEVNDISIVYRTKNLK